MQKVHCFSIVVKVSEMQLTVQKSNKTDTVFHVKESSNIYNTAKQSSKNKTKILLDSP